MAQYHFDGQLVKRSEGHRVVQRAAYNARAKLCDQQLGETWDFSRKKDLEHREILVPVGAPAWASDREQLWNKVEMAEGFRRQAQTARSFNIGLPVELSQAARLALVRDFVQTEFVDRGMIADFALHADAGNPHFHLLVTLRELDGDEFARTKQRAWNDVALFEHWREAWDLFGNRALANEGHAARIDHRSYKARGIDLIPQPKLFQRPTRAGRDTRDHVRERAAAFHQAARSNGDAIIAKPQIALDLLTSRRSTFSERDLVRTLHTHTFDAAQFHAALAAVKACPELVGLGLDESGHVQYSTRAIVKRERAILADAHLLARRRGHRVPERLIAQALKLTALELGRELNEEQCQAVRHVSQSGDLALVQGFAGTGKSTMLGAARLAWEGQGLTVVGGALTGKVAEDLEHDAKIPSRTLRSWSGSWENGKSRLTSRHVLVLDEAGMIGTAQFQTVLEEVRKAGAKLVLVGDVGQLQPIEIGAPMRLLQQHYAPAKLTTIVRQRKHPWQRKATLALALRKGSEGLDAYVQENRVVGLTDAVEAHRAMVAAWDRDRQQSPTDTALLIAFRRKDVQALNELARQARQDAGELGDSQQIITARGTRQFAVGDRVFFLRNDKVLGVRNGTLGTVERVACGKLVVRLDNQTKILVDSKHYNDFDHGYAGTVHKSQGATVDRAYVFASRHMDASHTYVSMSRHRQDATLFYSTREFRSLDALRKTLTRERKNRMALEILQAPQVERALAEELPPDAHRISRSRGVDVVAQLAALRRIAAQEPRSSDEVLEQFREVQALKIAVRDAERDLAQAVRASHDFEAQGRRTHSAELQRREQAVAQALQELRVAKERLGAARRHPELRARAERMASRRNLTINRACEQIDELISLRTEARRAEALDHFARARNYETRTLGLRGIHTRDRGRSFLLLGEHEVQGRRVLELQDGRGGARVLAYADQCTRLADDRLHTRGRSYLIEARARARPSIDHDLGR